MKTSKRNSVASRRIVARRSSARRSVRRIEDESLQSNSSRSTGSKTSRRRNACDFDTAAVIARRKHGVALHDFRHGTARFRAAAARTPETAHFLTFCPVPLLTGAGDAGRFRPLSRQARRPPVLRSAFRTEQGAETLPGWRSGKPKFTTGFARSSDISRRAGTSSPCSGAFRTFREE